jgi:hypothetical protein
MSQRGIKKTVEKKHASHPTIKHHSSADNVQELTGITITSSGKEINDVRSRRKRSGSDGSSKPGRGSNH